MSPGFVSGFGLIFGCGYFILPAGLVLRSKEHATLAIFVIAQARKF